MTNTICPDAFLSPLAIEEALVRALAEDFGRAHGALIKEWRLLQRAVFVVDRSGRISHVEYVADQVAEPTYGAAIDAARAATVP